MPYKKNAYKVKIELNSWWVFLRTELNSPSIMPFVFKGNMPTLKDAYVFEICTG